MKKRLPRIAAWLVAALMLCTLLPTTALAAPVCTATINFRIIPVYLDDTKPLGYDVDYGSAVNDTFACTYSVSHSTNANHQIPIKNWYPDALGFTVRSGYQWAGWAKYTVDLSDVQNPPFAPFYSWSSATTNVSGTGTHYIYLIYQRSTPATTTITLSYNANGQGVNNVPANQTQTVNQGQSATFSVGTAPTREGYLFQNWNTRADGNGTAYQPGNPITLSSSATLYAIWEQDANGNGVADKDEQRFSVTYTDGVEGEEIFPDQVTENLLSGTPTPAFAGGTPTREGYVFAGWAPAPAQTVTTSVTYVAQWENASPDDTGTPQQPGTPDASDPAETPEDDAPSDEIPKTGENRDHTLYLPLCLIAGGLLVTLAATYRAKRQRS